MLENSARVIQGCLVGSGVGQGESPRFPANNLPQRCYTLRGATRNCRAGHFKDYFTNGCFGKFSTYRMTYGQWPVWAVLVDEAGQDIRGRDLACVRQRVDVGCAQEGDFAKSSNQRTGCGTNGPFQNFNRPRERRDASGQTCRSLCTQGISFVGGRFAGSFRNYCRRFGVEERMRALL